MAYAIAAEWQWKNFHVKQSASYNVPDGVAKGILSGLTGNAAVSAMMRHSSSLSAYNAEDQALIFVVQGFVQLFCRGLYYLYFKFWSNKFDLI